MGGRNRQIPRSLMNRVPALHGKVPAIKRSCSPQKVGSTCTQHSRLFSDVLVHLVNVLEPTGAPIHSNVFININTQKRFY